MMGNSMFLIKYEKLFLNYLDTSSYMEQCMMLF